MKATLQSPPTLTARDASWLLRNNMNTVVRTYGTDSVRMSSKDVKIITK